MASCSAEERALARRAAGGEPRSSAAPSALGLRILQRTCFVTTLALRAAVRAPGLGLRLKCLPDHRGFRVFLGRELAEHALSGCAVNADPPDSGRRDERDLGLVLERGLRPFLEDRRGDPPSLGIAAHRAWLVVAHVDAGNDVGRAADEPNVGRPRRRSGLAEQRPVEVAEHDRGAALDHAFHDVNHLERGHRIDQLLGPLGGRGIAFPSQSGALQLPMTAQRLSVR